MMRDLISPSKWLGTDIEVPYDWGCSSDYWSRLSYYLNYDWENNTGN